MKRSEFITLLASALELDDSIAITEETVLGKLEQYDSIALLSIIALANEHFGIILSAADLASVTTVASLMKIIGSEHFED